MQKEFLEQCLADGLSLEAIGKRAGKHESTVSYWLKKHGLEAAKAKKHAAKGAVSKEELEKLLAAGLSLRDIAHRLQKSRDEARKCILLCANCHREVEAGIRSLPLNLSPDTDPG